MPPEDRVPHDVHPSETAEWLESLEDILHRYGPGPAGRLLARVEHQARRQGVSLPFSGNTPYVNSIPTEQQPEYPGDREIERRLKSIIRWNALAMVVRANRDFSGIGGHISTYASAATLFEVAFQHFLQGREHPSGGDFVYFQGHASPGVYARAFLEGRLSEEQLRHFRREAGEVPGLSSYPHPWLMPDFWELPTVSMGLSPIMAIYQARFNRYLHDRGIKDTSGQRVWCFLGDGEVDEPESLGSIALAAREQLDNLIFVINCNLQRLDGPVRGNGKIIQELETVFTGAGWNVLKVVWGSDWDPLLEADEQGLLVERMNEVVDGEYQKYLVEPGEYIRKHFFGKSAELQQMVEHLSDEQLKKLKRGGHDPRKVYAAYQAAIEHQGSPTVILAKTVKGYGLGEAGEGRNVSHQQKKLNEEEMQSFRSRFDVPIADEDIEEAPFYRPPEDSPEIRYLRQQREELGGFVPARSEKFKPLETPPLEAFADYLQGSGDREVATIMVFVRLLGQLVRNKQVGQYIVPIIPDEARTFGMDVLFRQCGIYSHVGQLYEPVDVHTLLYYREAKDGQLLEEGITEAGSASSFIAAGTALAGHGVPMIPFFSFYSMFGFQRVGDLLWAAADARSRGFLLGGIAGRTTLSGEGLQHQDGHSHLLAATVPNLVAYDPAYAYEFAVILQDGLRRMYQEGEPIFYYITMYNEKYTQPAMPEDAVEGIRKGMYRLRRVEGKDANIRPQLLGSGSILREVLRAQDILAERFEIGSDVWSVTSYKELRRDALATERWNHFHTDQPPRRCYVQQCLENEEPGKARRDGDHQVEPVIAASDYMRLVVEQIAPWVPGKLWSLGTDGFGRSDTREALRRHFEVDAEHIAFTALRALGMSGSKAGQKWRESGRLHQAMEKLGINPDKADPIMA